MSLPQSSIKAIVLGSLFHNRELCLPVFNEISFMNRSNWIQPENKLELIECINRKICISNKNNIRTHVAVEMHFDIDVCNAGMVYHIKRIACLSSSLLSHKFHGAVDGSDIFLTVDT